MKTNHPKTRAALGVAALFAIAILANWLVSLTPLGSRGIDFTENKIHTLTDGTRSILEELDTPVAIRYYATRGSDYMPERIKLHMRRVDDLLREYAAIADGNLRIEYLDPEPDTEAEDAANLDGISGERIGGQNLYFGIAISCIDRTSVIPFLNPENETMLEYNLSKAIAEVSTPSKPRIGIMSPMNLKGGPPMMPGQPAQQPWVIYQQIEQSYEVVNIPMEDPVIDPDEINILLVIHPAGITPAAEFAIDQYLLRGGTLVACMDAYSPVAESAGNPMMGGSIPAASTLPNLLKAWGVVFESGMALADPSYAITYQNGHTSLADLNLPSQAMPDEDNIITRNLQTLRFYVPGAISTPTDKGLAVTSLVRSSKRAGFIEARRASRQDPALNSSFRSTGKAYDLVTHLSGNFNTAFPNGSPTAQDTGDKDPTTASPSALKQADSIGNVFLIADIDVFYDPIAYRIGQVGNTRVANPINGNSSLLLNILDQAAGSKHLIGSRSRATTLRPFTVIKEMEAEFNQRVGEKIAELEEKQQQAQRRFNELQALKSQGSELLLSPEQEDEIRKLRAETVKYAKLIREQQKDLRRRKDDLEGDITLLNIAVMPAFVTLFGLGLYLQRRRATRAR